ncbi:MAG: energy-coupling factor transporter transmembrane component T [Lawsonibacter sp.]
MSDCFSSFHPAVTALWFALVLAVTVTTFHPALLLISLLCGLLWSRRLGAGWHFVPLLVLFLTAAVFNPLFSHAGATILWYFPNGNPLTLESILFGLGAGGMLTASLVWLGCLSRVMTADKWMCLLGRVVPALSLLLSMTLRALPRSRKRLSQIAQAQRQVGRKGHGGLAAARHGIRLVFVLVAWSMEEGVTCADSMDGRGYGLPGRTAYTNYVLDHRDKHALAILTGIGAYLLLMALRGALAWRYYPTLAWGGLDAWSLSAFLAWGMLCALPLYLDWKEAQAWNHIKSGT